MSNKHNFNSVIIQKHNYDSIIIRRHNFNSYILTKHYYNSIIDGFTQSNTQYAKFTQDNRIIINSVSIANKINAQFLQNSSMMITSGSISAGMKLSANFIQNNNVNVIYMVAQSGGNARFLQNNVIIANTNSNMNNTANFVQTSSMSASPISLRYYMVSDWDSSNLNTLDTNTLQQMDYQVV